MGNKSFCSILHQRIREHYSDNAHEIFLIIQTKIDQYLDECLDRTSNKFLEGVQMTISFDVNLSSETSKNFVNELKGWEERDFLHSVRRYIRAYLASKGIPVVSVGVHESNPFPRGEEFIHCNISLGL